ncbi:hypothetical protein C5167_013696 [Papaver somniferum]|uniref:Uncharacterized protein n=1 Tax=Papaver somniferum TaxID=3469 RepID=A0A4Y7J4I8_PAPSO|nr:uncharacterized protein LOC113359731 [Papaver somniferum]RZC54851.1 hypothetical protein C5167_013696 [Papaver somniferum]
MEIMIPMQNTEFNFDSGCSTPYMSAPSSPKRFGEYYSAPTSPMRASMVYQEYQEYNRYMNSTSPAASVIPSEDDFAFDFDGKSEKTSLTAADELFHGGKIKPLTFPMRSQLSNESTHKSSVSSPKSQGKKMFWESFTPREKKDFNPYSDSTDLTRKSSDQNRGRGRNPTKSNAPLSSNSSSRSRRETRSLSPLRVAEFSSYVQQQQEEEQNSKEQSISWNSKKSDSTSSSSSLKGSRKWRIRDFLLFRSASEGRASDKDPLRKYTALTRKNEDDRNSSFRSIDSTSSVSRRKGGGSASAHEVHYKVNRAVVEESKKKTYLPYKPGLLGCIGFNPTAYGLSQRL